MSGSEKLTQYFEYLKNSPKAAKDASDIDREAEEQANKNQSQRRWFRLILIFVLLLSLFVELVFLGFIIYWQGNNDNSFHLNEWVFGFIVNGVLLQTFALVKNIVVYSFD